MATTVIKGAAKVAVGVGAVYATCSQGVWSSSSQGTQALTHVRTKVLPATNDYINKVPSLNDVNNTVVDGWNSGVQKAFSGLASAPDYTKKSVSNLVQSLK